MKTLSIKGIKREKFGKSFSKKLREEGNIPCVVYGGKENIHFSAPKNSFSKLVYTPNIHKVELNIDGSKTEAIMQDIQFDPITDNIIHIDFIQLNPKQKVSMEVPISLIGNPIGVREGGNLRLNLRKLLIKALPEHLPENIEVNVENLRIGDKIRVENIENKDVDFLNPKQDVVVAVKRARVVIALEDEEDGEEGSEGESDGAEAKTDAAKETSDTPKENSEEKKSGE